MLVILAMAAVHAGHRHSHAGFPLFTETNLLLRANRVQCNLNAVGEQCVDPDNSSVLGGTNGAISFTIPAPARCMTG